MALNEIARALMIRVKDMMIEKTLGTGDCKAWAFCTGSF